MSNVSSPVAASDPASLYLRVRQLEGRLFADDVVARLPNLKPGEPFYAEWRARGASAGRLVRYLSRWSTPPCVLDLGCGNGWLSARLTKLAGCRVWGIDTNSLELGQAARVFHDPHVSFVECDIESAPFPEATFDAVVIASAIQYFADPASLFSKLRPLLAQGGEIHVLDSPIYQPNQVAAARARTRAYYHDLGVPEMADRYHHHTTGVLNDLDGLDATWLYNPGALASRLRGRVTRTAPPFPWLRFKSR